MNCVTCTGTCTVKCLESSQYDGLLLHSRAFDSIDDSRRDFLPGFRVFRTDFACTCTNLPFATSASSSVGQLQQSKYRAAIFAQSLSQGKQLLNYCVPQYFPCQHTSTYRVCSITTVVSPSSVHLLLFFVVDCTSHEAPVCIGGHRSRGGPVSQC